MSSLCWTACEKKPSARGKTTQIAQTVCLHAQDHGRGVDLFCVSSGSMEVDQRVVPCLVGRGRQQSPKQTPRPPLRRIITLPADATSSPATCFWREGPPAGAWACACLVPDDRGPCEYTCKALFSPTSLSGTSAQACYFILARLGAPSGAGARNRSFEATQCLIMSRMATGQGVVLRGVESTCTDHQDMHGVAMRGH